MNIEPACRSTCALRRRAGIEQGIMNNKVLTQDKLAQQSFAKGNHPQPSPAKVIARKHK
jgi:hypothetical protein